MSEDISEGLLRKVGEDEKLGKRIWREAKKMWVVAGPAIFSRFTTFGVNVITQAFVGHIGSVELAAYCLVQTVILRFANGITLGMASGLETLCGQAYGAKQYHMLGIYLQRAWIINFITSALLLLLFIFAAPILRALGQDEALAKEAGKIAIWLIPVIYSFIVSYTCQMFLQAQSKNVIIAYLAAFSLLLHVFLSWLLTMKYEYGITGAMISTILAFWIPNIGQMLFITMGGCPETWTGFSTLAFKDLIPLAKLSLSSGVMICVELWYYTILVLLTGYMNNAEIAINALSICLNINGWALMITLGFSAAASVRVANELGRGGADAAKLSIWNTVLTSLMMGFVLFMFFLLFKERLAYIFTTSSQVAEAVGSLSSLLAVSILLNSIQPVLSGVAVGAGWQSIVAYVNLVFLVNYDIIKKPEGVVGIPIGVIFGYVVKWGVKGVWIGMLFGTLMQTIVLVIITCETDWDKQVLIAQKRVSRWIVQPKIKSGTISQPN